MEKIILSLRPNYQKCCKKLAVATTSPDIVVQVHLKAGTKQNLKLLRIIS